MATIPLNSSHREKLKNTTELQFHQGVSCELQFQNLKPFLGGHVTYPGDPQCGCMESGLSSRRECLIVLADPPRPAPTEEGAAPGPMSPRRYGDALTLATSCQSMYSTVLMLGWSRARRSGRRNRDFPGWVSLDLPPPRVPQHRNGLVRPMGRA